MRSSIVLCLLLSAFAIHAADKPNIIVIYTDDHGYADLGIQGSRKDLKTPNLDQFARDGVRFARGYVTAPQCVPSRAGLLTGRYQTRFGLEMNPQGPLTLREKTIADRLKPAGYVTGMVGKWHLEPNRESVSTIDGPQPAGSYLPGKRGFDEYYKGELRNYITSYDLEGNAVPDAPRTVQDQRYRIDVQTDAALAFLKRRTAKPEQPFFLYLAYFAPHVPLEKPPKYMARFAGVEDETRQMALAAISAVDDGVGRVREFLRAHQLDEKTLIFFIGDNGAPTSRGAWNGSLNDPLVGEKGMLTDGGIRTPFLATWKGTLPAGMVYTNAVSALDVAATATAVAGLARDAAMDGTNLLPFLTGQQKGAPHDLLYWRWRSQAAVLDGRWKLVFLAPDRWLLFDHSQDAPEKNDVAAANPDVVKRLRARLESWAGEQSPPGLPKELVPQDRNFFDLHLKLFGGAEPQQTERNNGKKKRGAAAAPAAAVPASASVEGWQGRSCTLAIRNGALEVTPQGKAGFITHAGLNVAGPVELRLRIRASAGGTGKVQWRLAGSSDFANEDAATFTIPAGEGKDVRVPLPVGVGKKLIHLRLYLPGSDTPTKIESIALTWAGEGRAFAPEGSFWNFSATKP